MKKVKTIITIAAVLFLLFSYGNISGNAEQQEGSKSTQTKPQVKPPVAKPKPATSKSTPAAAQSKPAAAKPKPAASKTVPKDPKAEQLKKIKEAGGVMIGSQVWAAANLDVITFRNGDTIPEAASNEDWVRAGEEKKPAWCYYNNDPLTGKKYGKLYNWYAVNDPRGLAPAGWTLSDNDDWAQLGYYSGGQAVAGTKMKSITGWKDGNNGNNETGFGGLPGGYRVENGTFVNAGSNGIWWSSTENNTQTAYDHYLVLSGSLGRSNSPKQRGESVRCIRK
jgi:uncharacterized protein (TIGR02145 family)